LPFEYWSTDWLMPSRYDELWFADDLTITSKRKRNTKTLYRIIQETRKICLVVGHESQYSIIILCYNKTQSIVQERANEFVYTSIVGSQKIESANEYYGDWRHTKEKISIINRGKCAIRVQKKNVLNRARRKINRKLMSPLFGRSEIAGKI